MGERREIHHWQDVADPAEWTFEDEHGHEWFRRGEGETPQEMEEAGYPKVPMDTFADEIWMVEEQAGCGGRQGGMPSNLREEEHAIMELRRSQAGRREATSQEEDMLPHLL